MEDSGSHVSSMIFYSSVVQFKGSILILDKKISESIYQNLKLKNNKWDIFI